jgi:hypothetical protein
MAKSLPEGEALIFPDGDIGGNWVDQEAIEAEIRGTHILCYILYLISDTDYTLYTDYLLYMYVCSI